jgi:hypothetical protein
MPRKLARQHLLVILAYLVLTLALTYPLAAHFADGFVGPAPGRVDWGIGAWSNWWVKTALLNLGQSPFYTDYMFYPEGISLATHDFDFPTALIIMPVYLAFRGAAAFNGAIFLSFVLAGYTTYLLALRLIADRRAAFFAGLLFTFTPYHLSKLFIGHLNLAQVQWIPLYILLFFLWARGGAWRNGLLAALMLVVNARVGGWVYAIYCCIFSLAVVIYPAVAGERVRRAVVLRRFLLVFALFCLLVCPLVADFLRIWLTQRLPSGHNPYTYSADLLGFFIPSHVQTWGRILQSSLSGLLNYPFSDPWIYEMVGYYLGYTACFLAAYAVIKQRRGRVTFWLVIGLFFLVLAMGPFLVINQQRLPIPLLYALLNLLPLFTVSGVPIRFVVMAYLALAVLAGYGLQKLLPRGNNRLYVTLIALILLEYSFVPFPVVGDSDFPTFYKRLGGMSEDFAIVDTGFKLRHQLMYYQTIHGKKMLSGWLARVPKARKTRWDWELERIILLENPPPEIIGDEEKTYQWMVGRLQKLNIRYMIDHYGQGLDEGLENLGLPIIHDDGVIRVYEVK